MCCSHTGQTASRFTDCTGYSNFVLHNSFCWTMADTNSFSSGNTTRDDVASLYFFPFWLIVFSWKRSFKEQSNVSMKDVYLVLDMSYRGLRPNVQQQGNSLKFRKISMSSSCQVILVHQVSVHWTNCMFLKDIFSNREIMSYMIDLLYRTLGYAFLVFKQFSK